MSVNKFDKTNMKLVPISGLTDTYDMYKLDEPYQIDYITQAEILNGTGKKIYRYVHKVSDVITDGMTVATIEGVKECVNISGVINYTIGDVHYTSPLGFAYTAFYVTGTITDDTLELTASVTGMVQYKDMILIVDYVGD